jgi:hypothetical protein
MNATQNKEVMREAFAELAKGNGRPFVDLMADDFCWTVPGTTKWSKTYHGKQAVGMFFTAAEPLRNRDFIIVLLVFCVLMALTYVYLIRGHGFPQREYLYAALLAGNSIPLTVLYPWRATASALRSR